MTQDPKVPETPEPYRKLGEMARFYKALIQMGIGALGAVVVIVRLVIDLLGHDLDAKQAGEHLFVNIGLTLGLAAMIELAYTLFTHGADEALNPIMLGLAAALLIQLGQVDKLDLQQGLAAMFYAVALGLLFGIRERLARVPEPPQWSPEWWRRSPKWWRRITKWRMRRKSDGNGVPHESTATTAIEGRQTGPD